MARAEIVFGWGGSAVCFLAAGLFVNHNKHLLGNQNTQPSSRIKNTLAILLAVSLPFLPWAEQTAWNGFDPSVLDNKGKVLGLYFSQDGKKIGVKSAEAAINIWDIETKTFTPVRFSRDEFPKAFSPDGKYVAIGFVGEYYLEKRRERTETLKMDLLELANGKRIELRQTRTYSLQEQSPTEVNRVVFSPDSTHIAWASGRNKVIFEIWDVGASKLTNSFDTNNIGIGYVPLAYSPDGRYIASEYAYAEIAMWDTQTAALVQRLTEGHEGFIREIAYSPDGRYLAVAFNKKWPGWERSSEKGFIDIWDTAAGKIYKTLEWDSGNHIMGLAYSHDGKYIASFLQLEDTVNIWDVARGKQIKTLTGPVYGEPIAGIAYSPDGRYLAVASGQYIKLYNAR